MENNFILTDLNKPVNIEHIDFRIQSISAKGWATILAYKNARYDMNILDDVCGPENWQRDHKELKGNIYAGIGVYYNDRWIWKWDAGAESYSDKEKGEASDSFKRAGFNWGIGRELYDFPRILVQLKPDEFTANNGKSKQTFKLKLKEWDWTVIRKDEKISELTAKENKILRYDSIKAVFINNQKAPVKTDKLKEANDLLVIALKEMDNCVSKEQLIKVWSKYKQFQTQETFKLKKENLKKKL